MREREADGDVRREGLIVAALWAALTIIGEVLVWDAPILPTRYADTATVVDDAFLVLTRLAVPVFALVLSVLVVSLVRFRARGRPETDGPPLRGDRRIYAVWLAVTGGLAVLLIIYPGLTGLAELNRQADRGADGLTIQVEAFRWGWNITYPEARVTTNRELVLPVGQPIRFEVTSLDILHSFWIPGFRTKIDAVPGRTTLMFATPERTGGFEEDPNLRVQCAELCGLGHGVMAIPVRVLEVAKFEAWLQEQETVEAEG